MAVDVHLYLPSSARCAKLASISLREIHATFQLSSSSSALASCRTGVSKPSVNQP